jgi:hypothetical protein
MELWSNLSLVGWRSDRAVNTDKETAIEVR